MKQPGRLENALQRNKTIRRQYNLFKTFSNWWIYYAEKMGFLTAGELVFITRTGVSIRVPKQLYPAFKSIFLRQHYLEGLLLPLPDRPTIIDVGANVGFFSLFAASKWRGEVFAYEPVQANYEEMVSNVKANPHLIINCRRMAVSGASGAIEIFVDPATTLTTTATVCPSERKTWKAEEVKAVTLLDIFERERLETVDLLKMDCEGSEFSILYQTSPETLRRISQMAIEVHGNSDADNHNSEALQKFLTTAGFAVRSNKRGTYLWARREDKKRDFMTRAPANRP
jgi:FkbM family methyltransferase